MEEKQNNWNKVDATCESCGQITYKVKGITKQNLKRLFVPQWNATEMTINILLMGILLLAFLYNGETSQAREYVKLVESGEFCKQLDLAQATTTSAWQKQDKDPYQITVNSSGINWSEIEARDNENKNRTQSVTIRT